MDVQLKEGRQENIGINGGIGLINSRLTIEGPFAKKKKSTFLIGGARPIPTGCFSRQRTPPL